MIILCGTIFSKLVMITYKFTNHLEKQLQYSQKDMFFSLFPSLGEAEGNYVEVTLKCAH